MKKRMKLFIITPLIIILILIFSSIGIYDYFFYPKTPVVSTSTNIKLDNWNLLKKFFPTGFNLSFKELSAESNTIFSQEELTDLAIAIINEMPEIKKYITGLRVDIENNHINLYFHINYKNIPLEAKLIFSCKAEDGKGIFHYEDGKFGFIHIPKNLIFQNVHNNSFVQFNKENGDIILSFETIKQLDVKNLQILNNDLVINFKGTIRFWDWLKNNKAT
ncbi:hypothetical protein [Clostridium tarantellae]|uniref:DUF2140 family protein n=1 Tax=Clostridium tarantellae TaxID=39493 RepID=A0A6I1MXL6_9CLOT|nr:hypothetical protein [Clostridium tarantellae]MPQ44889.1 hypothetical protein [Clostridium tarantellae]